jgi:hypothetical protein
MAYHRQRQPRFWRETIGSPETKALGTAVSGAYWTKGQL